ncbi:heat shock protein G homolog [Halarchaeum acidiphilum MH1-52-1]|uniref:Heat shock protein G homolog n=2 Tax=Halarchaeum acidiphilum TaxID=489138 RepID=U3A326_9EURY|nr:heat shock protein G homolog [Halarchaeum acidiphilum MH1-52-1]
MSQPDQPTEVVDEEETPYEMSLSLNVLNHLGLNLYSNVPAVLSEAVANAWDADAENVSVDIDADEGRVTIVDDGHGMDAHDVNNRYLHVGYQRRQDEERPNRTPEHNRPVMGRKGIGKLSLLSIAETVKVYTIKDGDENAFRMDVGEIEDAIGSEEVGAASEKRTYTPTVLNDFPDDLNSGTKIVLEDLTKRVHTTESALRKRLARRFSILDSEFNFSVSINGEEVTATDRDYFHKLQFLWTFEDDEYVEHCRESRLEGHEPRSGETEDGHRIHGWIGTVEKPNDLVEDYPGEGASSDDLNKVSLMIRGRMAKPDLLESFNDSRMFTKYLVGEIHADFLDDDDAEDIATSNREDVVKEDPRYQDLLSWLRVELNHIAGRWNDLRNQQGSQEARQISAIDMWYQSLEPNNRERAKKLFGKINQMTVDDEDERRELFKHGVLAFENLKYEENLRDLETLDDASDRTVRRVLSDLDDIESSQYHQMAKHRKHVAGEFARRTRQQGVDEELYGHLVDHPWLLDPSWERAPIDDDVRDAVEKRLEEGTPVAAEEDERGAHFRCVRTATGYALVSLRHPTEPAQNELLEVVDVYRVALKTVLKEADRPERDPTVVFVVPEMDTWDDLEGLLSRNGVVVRRYSDLLEQTASMYDQHVERDRDAGRVSRLINDIETGDVFN